MRFDNEIRSSIETVKAAPSLSHIAKSKRYVNQSYFKQVQEVPKGEVKEVYEDVNTILGKCVDEIWEMFDDDGNGTFDVDETTDFIKHTLTEMGESPEYSEVDFL